MRLSLKRENCQTEVKEAAKAAFDSDSKQALQYGIQMQIPY